VRPVLARRVLTLLLLAAAAGAAPGGELLREEGYNFRIVGELPAGWQRRADSLVWCFSVDGIPHAYVHFVRERLQGELDVEEQVRKRAPQYRFPGAPDDAQETIRAADWAGYPAVEYLHEATLGGVVCRRRVLALYRAPFWYELIETVHGAKTGEIEACARGLRVFERGFRRLVEPLPEELRLDTAERTIADEELGYRLGKPLGFVRAEVDPGADPGLRVAFTAQAPDPRCNVRVRLFEYGVRDAVDPAQWFDVFYAAFADAHRQPRREPAPAPALPRTRLVRAERFSGEREGIAVTTLVLLVQAASGRVFVLRVRTAQGADTEFAEPVARILASLAVDVE